MCHVSRSFIIKYRYWLTKCLNKNAIFCSVSPDILFPSNNVNKYELQSVVTLALVLMSAVSVGASEIPSTMEDMNGKH